MNRKVLLISAAVLLFIPALFVQQVKAEAPRAQQQNEGLNNELIGNVVGLTASTSTYGVYPDSLKEEQPVTAKGLSVTEVKDSIVVNTGAGLKYAVNADNGNITTTKLNGTELATKNGKKSQINIGLGSSADVSWEMSSSGSTVLITVNENDKNLIHYYTSRSGENIIYMATYIKNDASFGELRYIFRGNGDVLTKVSPYSDNSNSIGAIESQDVNGHANGYTTSKFFGNDQAKSLSVRGATGDGAGVFMAYGNRERSSGGPFFRDIQFQSGGDTEIYNYMFSGHNQTEALRKGLHGPYALIFTTGETPNEPDFSWMSGLNLQGWESKRGEVSLNGLTGMDSNYEYTIGFANNDAQYWTASSSKGKAVKNNMIPGTYTMTVYKGELAVYTQDVTVTAASTTRINTINIEKDPSTVKAIWRIGDWDGTPLELLYGQTISLYHPSDSRNKDRGSVSFDVDNASNEFPAIQTREQNSPLDITFDLDASQASSSHVLKIGITAAYNSGRPSVRINDHKLKLVSTSSQPKSRSFTIGTYRGNNACFSWTIPASYLVEGTNTISIEPISGKSDLSNWLSAGWVYDAIELLN